jgi:quinoprotein glucose dehydrogenase
MKRLALRAVPAVAVLVAGLAVMPRLSGQGTGQPSTANGEWPQYTADLRGSKYSPLAEINATNFSKLEVAWRFKTDNLGPRPETKLEGTPLMVKGTLYATAGTRRAVVALDPRTGEQKWMYSMDEGERATRWAPQISRSRRSVCTRRRPSSATWPSSDRRWPKASATSTAPT